MRKISKESIMVFSALTLLSISLTFLTYFVVVVNFLGNNFQSVISFLLVLSSFYLYSIVVYRLFFKYLPLGEGEIEEESKEEFLHNIYSLYYLLFFRSLICTRFIPTPIMRMVYLSLGAKLGANTYSTGIILDPPFTQIGMNTIIGQDALLYSHAIERKYLAYKNIIIGDDVTIGAKSVVMSGVVIGNGSVVAAGSVVLKDAQIGSNEVWGGVPAKYIKTLSVL